MGAFEFAGGVALTPMKLFLPIVELRSRQIRLVLFSESEPEAYFPEGMRS